jgi:hypothetical protein
MTPPTALQPVSTPPPLVAPTPAAQWELPLPLARQPMRSGQSVPPELLLVVALMLLAAAFCFYIGLKPMPDIVQVTFSGNQFGAAVGAPILAVLLVFTAFGGACLYLARRLMLADRVARGLSYVLLAGLGGTIAVTGSPTTQLTLTMVASFASLAVLALFPNVQRFFTNGPDSLLPVPVTIACTLLQAWAAVMAIVGICLLPCGALSQRLVIGGLVMVCLALLAVWCAREVKAGSPTGRSSATIGAVIYGFASLVVGRNTPAVIVPLSMAIGVMAFLWLPLQSQQFFGASPRVESRTRDSAWLASLSADQEPGDR